MAQTVYLDECKHAVTMLRGLKQLKQEQDFCDFTIKVEGFEYQVHKNVLSVGSPYFKAMLKHDTKESRDGIIEMKDVDPMCVKSCIQFLYSGNFEVPDGKIGHLLHVAIMLQLDEVKEAISDILKNSLSAENFYETRKVAELYDLQTISKECNVYYEENFMAISCQSEFINEKKSHIINILKSKNLKLSEEEKLLVSLRWAGDNLDKNDTLLEFIKLINLKNVASEYLKDLLENHPLISNDLRLYKLINASFVQKLECVNETNKNADKELIVLFDLDSDCLQSYGPSSDRATKFHNEKFKHLIHFSAITLDSYIYILCNNKSVHRLNFRDKNSKWERMQKMLGGHGCRPSVASLFGSLYVIGNSGALAYGVTNVVEKFDSAANLWSRLQDKPKAIRNTALVSLYDSVFCVGGHDGNRSLNSFCKFTPSASHWVDLEPMKNARELCGAVAVDKRIFVVGGLRDSHELNEVECYDVASGYWTSLSPTIKKHCGVSHHINGWIFVVSWRSSLSEVEKYDIANDRWSKVKFKDVEQCGIINGSMKVQL